MKRLKKITSCLPSGSPRLSLSDKDNLGVVFSGSGLFLFYELMHRLERSFLAYLT